MLGLLWASWKISVSLSRVKNFLYHYPVLRLEGIYITEKEWLFLVRGKIVFFVSVGLISGKDYGKEMKVTLAAEQERLKDFEV